MGVIKVGDDEEGFTIEVNALRKHITIAAWGFWSVGVSESFERLVTSACRELEGEKTLLFELGQLKPLRTEGQEALTALVRRFRALKVASATMRTNSDLTRLQLRRIAKVSKTKVFLKFL